MFVGSKVKRSPLVGAAEYAQRYSVTTDGRVISERSGRVLSPSRVSQTRRYAAVLLSLNGRQKLFYVHRLVAMAFLPNPQGLPCVRHIDGDLTNNDVTNLEWCSYSESAKRVTKTVPRASRQQPARDARPERPHIPSPTKEFPTFLLPDAPLKVQAYAKARASGMTYQAIADEFGVSRQSVYQALHRAFSRKVPTKASNA